MSTDSSSSGNNNSNSSSNNNSNVLDEGEEVLVEPNANYRNPSLRPTTPTIVNMNFQLPPMTASRKRQPTSAGNSSSGKRQNSNYEYKQSMSDSSVQTQQSVADILVIGEGNEDEMDEDDLGGTTNGMSADGKDNADVDEGDEEDLFMCEECGITLTEGDHYKCQECEDCHLCENCYLEKKEPEGHEHKSSHTMISL
jgi:hypothetical protein